MHPDDATTRTWKLQQEVERLTEQVKIVTVERDRLRAALREYAHHGCWSLDYRGQGDSDRVCFFEGPGWDIAEEALREKPSARDGK